MGKDSPGWVVSGGNELADIQHPALARSITVTLDQELRPRCQLLRECFTSTRNRAIAV